MNPPSHLDPDLRDLWHAACRLLQQNMGLTTLSKDGDLAKHSDNSDDGWHNSGVRTVFVDRRIT